MKFLLGFILQNRNSLRAKGIPLSHKPRRTAASFCGRVQRQKLLSRPANKQRASWRRGSSRPGCSRAPGRAHRTPAFSAAPAARGQRHAGAAEGRATPFPGPRRSLAAASELPRGHRGETSPVRDKTPLRCLTADTQRDRPAFHLLRSASRNGSRQLVKMAARKQATPRRVLANAPVPSPSSDEVFCLFPGKAQHNMSHCFP